MVALVRSTFGGRFDSTECAPIRPHYCSNRARGARSPVQMDRPRMALQGTSRWRFRRIHFSSLRPNSNADRRCVSIVFVDAVLSGTWYDRTRSPDPLPPTRGGLRISNTPTTVRPSAQPSVTAPGGTARATGCPPPDRAGLRCNYPVDGWTSDRLSPWRAEACRPPDNRTRSTPCTVPSSSVSMRPLPPLPMLYRCTGLAQSFRNSVDAWQSPSMHRGRPLK